MRTAVLAPCDERIQAILATLPLEIAYEPDMEWLEQAEIIIGEPETDWLPQLKNLRWIQMTWAGVDRYAKMENFPENVVVTNASGAFGETIAEGAIAMQLALSRRLPAYAKSNCWEDKGSEKTICGSVALILGMGDLGAETAKRCKALGMTTIGISRTQKISDEKFDLTAVLSDIDDYLPQADTVFCCLPGTPETVGLLNRNRLAQMKPDAILINVGRGSLIDTEALTELLQQGHLFGVGLDVTNPEPLPEDHPLWQMENVIITPHVAGVSFGHLKRTEDKIWQIILDNLQKYIAGSPLKNVVDLKQGY